jgi:hypothetical protein
MLKKILERLAAVAAPKVVPALGRNDVCHCGSGRKYKRCCLQKDADRERSAREAGALPTGPGGGGGRSAAAPRSVSSTPEYRPPKGRGPA